VAAISYDFLFKNGHVIDPANGIDRMADVAVSDGKIARVERDIPPGGVKIIDAAGMYVVPGIIDIHAHVYTLEPFGGNLSIDADTHLIKSGVTTAVDAGTTGWHHFPKFLEHVIEKSKIRILAYLNIANKGMVEWGAEQVYANMQAEVAAEVAAAHPEVVVGIKAAHYWPGPKPFDADHPPWASTDKAIEAARLCGLHAMIDFQPNLPECPYEDLILKKMRSGDIHTHVFATQFPTVDANGRVYAHMREARSRGVYFDLGHGAGSFWFRNGVRALLDGFPPDTLSTDIHTGSIRGAVLDMAHVMSKFLNMGMSLNEVIMRSTAMPAKLINRPALGSLSVGGEADVAVFQMLSGDFGFIDCGRAKIKGDRMLECAMTMRGGEILYDGRGLSMPEWKDAPEAYWKSPYRGDAR